LERDLNNIINNKKFWIYLSTLIIVLNFLIPFVVYPLYERSLVDVYEKSFDGVDSSFILKTIKTVLFIYMWTDQAYELFVRIFILSAIYLFGVYLLEVEGKLTYREILLILLFAELTMILGNYLTILFNYAQLKFGLGAMKVYESPLSLIFYFSSLPKNSPIYSLVSSINGFTLIYFYVIYHLISKKIHTNKFQLVAITIFVFFFFILIKISDPVDTLFFNNNNPGAL
jgi:hypothetical protein